MKTMTVRDVRQHWPDAERALATEREIVITRDGTPVARLLPIEPVVETRKRFDPVALKRWQDQTFGKSVVLDSQSGLLKDRDEREFE